MIHRLESQTEDIALKVAILKFFTKSVRSQPGLIQLLLSNGNEISKSSEDEGCLKSILTLLKNLELNFEPNQAALQVSVLND